MIRSIQFSPTTEWLSAQEEFEAACRDVRDFPAVVRGERLLHFVRPADRFLPVSLLRHSIDEIVSMSFDVLRASPGVGLVKIRNLAGLLRRIAADFAAASERLAAPASSQIGPQDSPVGDSSFVAASPVAPAVELAVDSADDPVTEVEWRQWCSRIALHGLESEFVGRLVDRLGDLPRSIWHTPLGRYCELSLEQLHELKAYGRRRVRAVTAAFRRLNQLLLASEACPGLTTTLGPELVAAADAWAVDVILERARFETHCYLARVIAPVLVQIRHDAGDVTYGILLERFAARLPALTVLCAPVRRPGEIPFSERYSTSRLHQYRQDGAAIVAVRWPRGADLCRALLGKSADEPGVDDRRHVAEVTATLFPSLRSSRSDGRSELRSPGDDRVEADAPA